MRFGGLVVAPNVRDDAEVLGHPGQQRRIVGAETGGLGERRLGGVEVSGLQLDATEGIEGPGGETPVTHEGGHGVALLQRTPRARRVTGLVRQHRPAAEGLRHHGVVTLPCGQHDHRAIDCLGIAWSPGSLECAA